MWGWEDPACLHIQSAGVTVASHTLGMSEQEWTQLEQDRLGLTRKSPVSCRELGNYLLLENVIPPLNGGYFSNSLRNHSHVTIGPCRGKLDLYMGHVSQQSAKCSKHIVSDGDTGRRDMHLNTHRESGG